MIKHWRSRQSLPDNPHDRSRDQTARAIGKALDEALCRSLRGLARSKRTLVVG